jgi:dihydrofolate reductase
MITIVAACSSNRVIGKDNKLIWNVPGDLKRFKEMTTGHTVLMGRKTYESIGRPLPNRRNVVLSRNAELLVEGCLTYTNLLDTLDMYKNDVFIIGGEEIYRQSLPYVDRIELTLIHKEFEGDAFFPEIPLNFKMVSKVDMKCDEFDYSYITYESL